MKPGGQAKSRTRGACGRCSSVKRYYYARCLNSHPLGRRQRERQFFLKSSNTTKEEQKGCVNSCHQGYKRPYALRAPQRGRPCQGLDYPQHELSGAHRLSCHRQRPPRKRRPRGRELMEYFVVPQEAQVHGFKQQTRSSRNLMRRRLLHPHQAQHRRPPLCRANARATPTLESVPRSDRSSCKYAMTENKGNWAKDLRV